VYVTDASLLGPLVIPDEAASLDIDATRLLLSSVHYVPGHWHVEVANMLRSAMRRDRITRAIRDAALERLSYLVAVIVPEAPDGAWTETIRLSDEYDLTPYDAAYVELALLNAFPLITRDRRLARAAVACGLKVLDFHA
jgi:predicted nucleic acid-binding protein